MQGILLGHSFVLSRPRDMPPCFVYFERAVRLDQGFSLARFLYSVVVLTEIGPVQQRGVYSSGAMNLNR